MPSQKVTHIIIIDCYSYETHQINLFHLKYLLFSKLSHPHPISSQCLLYLHFTVGMHRPSACTPMYIHVHEQREFTSFTRMACVESALHRFYFFTVLQCSWYYLLVPQGGTNSYKKIFNGWINQYLHIRFIIYVFTYKL